MEEILPLPVPGRCLVAQIDYGREPSLRGDWLRTDLAWTGEPPFAVPAGREGLWIRGAESLLGWSRTLAGDSVWAGLEIEISRRRVALACRFPRHARELARLLGARGVLTERWETNPDGSIPPLYRETEESPDLLRLHLEHEWFTGMAAARGGIALVRIAALLASGSRSAGGLAGKLGLTSGAVRSYLRWMEDAALVRRDGRAYALRHPLLATLFSSAPVPEPAQGRTPAEATPPPIQSEAAPPPREPEMRPSPATTSRPWNPVEID